jgi:dTMP kinase
MDAYQLRYHQRVRQGYLEMAKNNPDRWKIIDAAQKPIMVQSDIQSQLLEYFPKVS